eukprot:scaffold8420_cov120-Cylindrotheca_fusiformis.AAC.1
MSASKEKELQEKQRVGVADYFAILGVGEELIWNHAQQKISGKNESDKSHPEEDDAAMIERFYREIVDCRVVAVDENPGMEHYLPKLKQKGNPDQYLSGVPSPSLSDVASGVGVDAEKVELEGWTIINQTRPVGIPYLHSKSKSTSISPSFFRKGQVWDANLDPISGLPGEIRRLAAQVQREHESVKSSTPLKDLRRKVTSTFAQRQILPLSYKKRYHLSYRRRAPDESNQPGIADIALKYAQLHKVTLDMSSDNKSNAGSAVTASTVSQKGAAALLRVAEAGKHAVQNRVLGTPAQLRIQNSMDLGDMTPIRLETLLKLPAGFDEWSIPDQYQLLNFPSCRPESKTRTIVFSDGQNSFSSGIPARLSAGASLSAGVSGGTVGDDSSREEWQDIIRPRLVQGSITEDEDYIYVPILAIRRQRVGEEEKFKEDPAIVDIAVSFWDSDGDFVMPAEDSGSFDDESSSDDFLVQKTEWEATMIPTGAVNASQSWKPMLGTACLIIKRNLPLGFCDAAFKTTVLDRFPYKNYKGLPLPEEELPMFCYPTGCRLQRARFRDAPLPQYYGFVVKNERGDSIYVSCVSFMAPLTKRKEKQLVKLSEKRSQVSLPHSLVRDLKQGQRTGLGREAKLSEFNRNDDESRGSILTGFDEMVTFENKTICLVSRFPYWTAFRRFLSHLHIISCSSSDIPLERYISHLLLTVPIPKPGGPIILIPLPSFNTPMVLWSPSPKDLPLVDLSYERLVSCLDIPTIVTVVLGLLALERKVIVMSTRPSLVLDVCELLRSLLFPFDLCIFDASAPYVPRLTEPFMSCLDFPGAIFVGIHDDKLPNGLAAVVRRNMPEDSTIVDLDSGSVDCSGDRMAVLNTSWGLIPPGARAILVSEVEILCRDAGIVPGQEPLDSQIDSCFEASSPLELIHDDIPIGNLRREPLDDRAIRDAFLRFFCAILGGYERYLVVPDVDFLVSGEDWFDSKGFLASVSEDKAAFLGTFASTQLFQSFIQRRTEASDVHCLLFDECLSEYHSSTSNSPYGRLGGDVETLQSGENSAPQIHYSLLVDQSATESQQSFLGEKSFDTDSRYGSDYGNSGDHSTKIHFGSLDEFAINDTGDWVTTPSRIDIPLGSRFVYCVDGNSTFPDRLDPKSFLPKQPESWLLEMNTQPTPMLTRSDREIEEAERRRKLATSYRGLQNQRRCLWQLPKLMGSHFLGTWLLCVPAFVAQPKISHERQSKYLLHALGALRLLRSKQRIVPDEAAYRALIVACGRTKSDRRMELVKLFGLLRSDGIFPSAVTLGQYTRALAEGYSKRSIGTPGEEASATETSESATMESTRRSESMEPGAFLCSLDGNLSTLEEAGRRWRQKSSNERDTPTIVQDDSKNSQAAYVEPQKKRSSKPWLPVAISSSFVPKLVNDRGSSRDTKLEKETIRLLAIWSRTKSCDSCGYVPLDEEIQAGWDLPRDGEAAGGINCPRCGQLFIPMLAYKEFSIEEALTSSDGKSKGKETDSRLADFTDSLPPQIWPAVKHTDAAYITYISPESMRLSLERQIEEHGEEVLERDRLQSINPELFYNLWWYSARFSLPLPLPVSNSKDKRHYCAFGAWDHHVAVRGCRSCARVLYPFSTQRQTNTDMTMESAESFGEYPLLSRFNLQGFYSNVWDHEDLSEILVKLVEACDKRDFRPVLECLLRCNNRRMEKFGVRASSIDMNCKTCDLPKGHPNSDSTLMDARLVELDAYRTILYLAKYQCTTAFHAFFPATLKPCKGYHFWCPVAPLPIYDRLFREGAKHIQTRGDRHASMQDVSDIALAFRSVFGIHEVTIQRMDGGAKQL